MVRRKLPFSTLVLIAITAAVIAGNILFDVDLLQPLEYRVYDGMSRLRHRKAGKKTNQHYERQDPETHA